MIGRFLEWSVVSPDIRESVEFYSALGFSSAQVGDAWSHPYAVLTDGRIHVGLHQRDDFLPSGTFVKPGLLQFLGDAETRDITLEFRHLGDGVFNELGWFDPSGQLIRLVEARTFSPVERRVLDLSLCGYFLEIALPAAARETAKAHWERLGFVGMDETDALLPHVSCTSDSINVGFYDPVQVRESTLLFEVDDLRTTLERLGAAGIRPAGRIPAPFRRDQAVALTAPEGTALLLTERMAA